MKFRSDPLGLRGNPLHRPYGTNGMLCYMVGICLGVAFGATLSEGSLPLINAAGYHSLFDPDLGLSVFAIAIVALTIWSYLHDRSAIRQYRRLRQQQEDNDSA